jgi:hypothetical protein
MKKLLLALCLTTPLSPIFTPTTSYSQMDAAGALLTAAAGAGGFAIGESFKDQWQAAPYVGAALAPVLANWGYGAFKTKTEEEKLKFYLSGRNYERWIQSQKTWYQSTLDPHTGRPQAFTGLLEMDRGLPSVSQTNLDSVDIGHIYTIPVKLPAGTYQGVPYTERVEGFPKLP